MVNELRIPVPIIPSERLVSPSNFLAEQTKPVIFSVGQVFKGDGSELMLREITAATFYVCKLDGAAISLWDKDIEDWKPQELVPEEKREFFPLEPINEGIDRQWKGILFLLGDANKYPHTDIVNNSPRYAVRCHFRYKNSFGIESDGTSEMSISLGLRSLLDDIKAGLKFIGSNPADPASVKYYIDGSVETYIELKQVGQIFIKCGMTKIEISNGLVEINGPVKVNGHVSIVGSLSINGTAITS